MFRTVTLQASGKRFRVRPGETVLEGARRAGVALPYSCLAGACGSCKATLLEGECFYPRIPPSALDAAERASRQVLLCQAVPVTDLVIAAREVASVADMPRKRLTLKLVDKAFLNHDVVRLLLLSARGERLRRLPGQYLDILLDDGRRRAFSIANAPHAGDHLELHVRHVAGGGFTSWVFDEARVGAIVHAEGPLGTFVPREDSERPLLMVAGGTGFAPIKAIIEHFRHLGSRRKMTLYWGARTPADLYLRTVPEGWAADDPGFRFIPVIADPSRAGNLRAGFVHEAVLEDQPDLAAFDVYMSGPPALIDAGRHLFVAAGLPGDRLFFDSFEYAPDVIAAILGKRAGIDER